MKLRNKQTGEIADLSEGFIMDTHGGEMIQIKPVAINNKEGYVYDSLAELNEEWEDYEEPKEYWYIDYDGGILLGEEDNSSAEKMMISMGNHFESLEEAEKAVEKLKAWKRLKDKGFKVDLWDYDGANYQDRINTGRILFRIKDYGRVEENDKDLDLLFGGEE